VGGGRMPEVGIKDEEFVEEGRCVHWRGEGSKGGCLIALQMTRAPFGDRMRCVRARTHPHIHQHPDTQNRARARLHAAKGRQMHLAPASSSQKQSVTKSD